MRQIWILPLVLLAASRAFAQGDNIRMKPGKGNDVNDCEITAMTCKEVIYTSNEIPNQKLTAKDVLDVSFGNKSKPFEYSTGDTKMNDGQYAQAIAAFNKALARSEIKDPVKQSAYRNIAECQYRAKQWDDAVGTLRTLRKEKKDGFYLRESFELQYKCFSAKGDARQMESTLNEFAQAGTELGMADWTKSVELMRAELLETQGKYGEAARIHARYVQDASEEIAMSARLGEMRCFSLLKNWSSLKSKADGIIAEARTKKGQMPDRLMTGAYNGLGDCAMSSNNAKDALMHHLRGVVEFNRSGDKSPEHEEAIAKSAIAMAKCAAEQKENKEEYRRRALGLMAELQTKYEGSRWMAEVKKAVEEK